MRNVISSSRSTGTIGARPAADGGAGSVDHGIRR
jgi:hypothetical protein